MKSKMQNVAADSIRNMVRKFEVKGNTSYATWTWQKQEALQQLLRKKSGNPAAGTKGFSFHRMEHT